MPLITSIERVLSIKVGTGSTVKPDGTIDNPVDYDAADVTFSDGVIVQVERPLTLVKLEDAYKAATMFKGKELDGFKPGDSVLVGL